MKHIAITPASLPEAEAYVKYEAPYSKPLQATGGPQTPGYHWELSTGSSTPNGLSLNEQIGLIEGEPTVQEPAHTFEVTGYRQGWRDSHGNIHAGGGADVQITTQSLANAFLNNNYDEQLNASEGVPGYNWEVSYNALPEELKLSPSGLISGTPSSTGQFEFYVKVTDAAGGTAEQNYILVVAPSSCTGNPRPGGRSRPSHGGMGRTLPSFRILGVRLPQR